MRDRWGAELTAGRALGGFSLTEPHAGSDAAAITTRAVADGDGFRVTGRKAWVSLVGEADLFLVACRTGTERGTSDVLMAAIPREREGVSTERVYRKMASAFLPIGEMALDDVRVEADEVIAPPGAGFGAALGAIDVARVDIAAIAVGLAESALDIALRHARDRAAFGGTILDLQGIRFALADVATDIAAGRCCTRTPPRGSARRRAASRPRTPSASAPTWRCGRRSSAARCWAPTDGCTTRRCPA